MISTARLKCINKQENQRRKFVCVMNDVAKSQQELYSGYIDKEKHEAVQNCDKHIVSTRKTVVRQRVLRRCMKKQRDEVRRSEGPTIYGQYHGVSMDEISGKVDPYIEQHHPKIRRQQKIDNLFKDGYNNGAILDPPTIKAKVQKYFERPLVELHTYSDKPKKKPTEDKLSLPPLGKPFYTGSLSHVGKFDDDQLQAEIPDDGLADEGARKTDTKGKVFVSRKVNKFLEEDIPDDLSVNSDFPATVPFKAKDSRPLTLPPIKIGTDKADNVSPDDHKTTDCITELLERINKAKERRERDIKVKKEKRAKRLLADRVQRNQPASFLPHSDAIEFVTETELNECVSRMTSSRPTTKRLEVRKNMVKRQDKDKLMMNGDVSAFLKGETEPDSFRLPPLNLKRQS